MKPALTQCYKEPVLQIFNLQDTNTLAVIKKKMFIQGLLLLAQQDKELREPSVVEAMPFSLGARAAQLGFNHEKVGVSKTRRHN